MKTLSRKLKTFFSFSFEKWKILGLAYYLLLKVRLLLFIPSPWFVKEALTQKDRKTLLKTSFSREELLYLFQIAWRYQPRKPSCLVTALAQQRLLRRYGFSVPLRIGVRKKNGRFEAHAWCEERLTLDGFQALEALRS